jgi:PAS domain S-box-containing protein
VVDQRWLEFHVFGVGPASSGQLALVVKDITQQVAADAVLQHTEAFNRCMVTNSPDCIKILCLKGKLQAILTGQNLLGITDVTPLLNTSWLEFWDTHEQPAVQAALDAAAAGGRGQFIGFFPTPAGQHKWWDVTVSPILNSVGLPERLLAVSREITQRRQSELNAEFLAAVSRDLMAWTTVDEMVLAVGEKFSKYLQLSRCAFAEVDDTVDSVTIEHDWHRSDMISLRGSYRLADFVSDAFVHKARAGEIIVVDDVSHDPMTADHRESMHTLGIRSFINVPLIRDGHWLFVLCIYKTDAYTWRPDEIELTQELTTRIWTRMERLRAENALRQSEGRFRALVTASVDAVYQMSPDWREMRQLHGQNFVVDTTSPTDQWMETYIAPQDRPDLLAVINEAISTKSRFQMEHQVLRLDGTQGWTYSQAVPILDAKGCILEWFGTASDVTLQKHAEEALRESEDRYRHLFNAMDEGYCIIEMIFDADQKPVDYAFVAANPSFTTQTGMQWVPGQRVREILPDLEQFWFDTYGTVALTGQALRFVRQAKPIQAWFDVYAFPCGAPGSQQVALLFTNITERINASEALRKSEERFRALFDNGPIAMYSCDRAGVIQDFNLGAVKIWGASPQPGETDQQFHAQFKIYRSDGTLVRHAYKTVQKLLKDEAAGARNMEMVLERPDGLRLTLVVDMVPLRDDQGQMQGVMTCFYDVTERSRLEQETQAQATMLADLDRRKDEFLAMLSHELRNPLAPISNAVRLLRLHKNDDPVQVQARNVIERQVGQLNHLVDDLLEVSRITTGRVQLRQERIALCDIVARAVESTQPLVTQRGHTLTVTCPETPVWVDGDAARLEQVVVNLLTNAAKYTDDSGRIAVTLSTEGSNAVLQVLDTGIGIAPELLPRVFDMFSQAERSLDRSQGGLGIGLCLVQRLVELHGGHVAVHSVLGRGSEFTVHLPTATGQSLHATVPVNVAGNAKLCRVLVVDDNVDAAQTLADLLSMSGHEVRIVHDGLGAVADAVAWCPDVVLLDIGLPGLNGFEVAKRIRREAAHPTMTLVALTGYGQAADRQRSREAGFDHHLVKPADFDEVEKILAAVV